MTSEKRNDIMPSRLNGQTGSKTKGREQFEGDKMVCYIESHLWATVYTQQLRTVLNVSRDIHGARTITLYVKEIERLNGSS